MDVDSRYILTGGIKEFVFFCSQVGKPPAWFKPVLTQADVEAIPINSIVILYGSYHKSNLYPYIQRAWEENLISTKVILPGDLD